MIPFGRRENSGRELERLRERVVLQTMDDEIVEVENDDKEDGEVVQEWSQKKEKKFLEEGHGNEQVRKNENT